MIEFEDRSKLTPAELEQVRAVLEELREAVSNRKQLFFEGLQQFFDKTVDRVVNIESAVKKRTGIDVLLSTICEEGKEINELWEILSEELNDNKNFGELEDEEAVRERLESKLQASIARAQAAADAERRKKS